VERFLFCPRNDSQKRRYLPKFRPQFAQFPQFRTCKFY
jgi:hypothetical protein